MNSLKKLSNKKLDQLQDRLLAQVGKVSYHSRLIAILWKVSNERLRRMGL